MYQGKLIGQNKYYVNFNDSSIFDPPIIHIVTTSDDFNNSITWDLPKTSQFLTVGIYRESVMYSNNWEIIGKTDAQIGEYIDHTSTTANLSFRYRVTGFDKCGYETPLSISHRTINLRGTELSSQSYLLTWNEYEGRNIEFYNVYRGSSPKDLKLVASGFFNQFYDTSDEVAKGETYYRVSAQAVEENSTKSTSASLRNLAWSNLSYLLPTTGNSDTTYRNLISIYPNPCSTLITVFFPNPLGKTYEISIFDLTGKRLYTTTTNTSQLEMDVRNLKDGIYLLRAKGELYFEGKIVVCNVFK